MQFVDVDFEGYRAASQPRNSQGHFLSSTPYRARPLLTELLGQLAAVPHKHLRDQSLCCKACFGCNSEEAQVCERPHNS